MKIAITSQGNDIKSNVDLRFGRAPWILIYDTQTGELKAHNNSVNLNIAQGAGIQTGQNIANTGAEAVITGNVGPNAFRTLIAANVAIYLAKEQTVEQAIEAFKAGNLEKVDNANVQGHWV